MANFNLGDLMGMDPWAFQAGRNQIQAEQQAAQQQAQLRDVNLQAEMLKNMWSVEDRDMQRQNLQEAVRQQVLANQTLELEGQEKRATSTGRIGKTNAEALDTMDKQVTNAEMRKLERDLMSDDPTVAARASTKLLQSADFQKIRLQNDARVAQAEAAAAGRYNIAAMNEQGRNTRAQDQLDMRLQQMNQKAQQALGKMNHQQAQTHYIGILSRTDPASPEYQQAAQALQAINEAAAANALYRQQGQLDMGAVTNMPTMAPPKIRMPQGTPAAGANPTNPAEREMAGAIGPLLNEVNNMPATQAAQELAAVNAEIARVRDPAQKQALQEYANLLQRRVGAASQAPAQASQKPAAAPANNVPSVGTVKGGYRFKGGDPSKKENWEKV